jgi:hypothetical protein
MDCKGGASCDDEPLSTEEGALASGSDCSVPRAGLAAWLLLEYGSLTRPGLIPRSRGEAS